MKFIVKSYGNEYDVKLHPDSKEKINKIYNLVFWSMVGAAAVRIFTGPKKPKK